MRVLLIAVNAKYIHSNPAVYSLRAYAQAALGNQPEVGIEIAEYTINQNTENILADIFQNHESLLLFLQIFTGIDRI